MESELLMQRSSLVKTVGISLLSLSAAIAPLTLPTSAQVTTPNPVVTPDTGVRVYENRDRKSDWGWLGLLGLIGLAGLAGRKRQEPTAYRDPNLEGRATYRD